MANFLFLYYGGGMAATLEQQKKSMETWTKWFGQLGKGVVDAGAPTKPGKLISKNDTKPIGTDPVAGYTIVKANNLDEAVDMAKGAPNIQDGLQVAVYEILPM